MLNLALGLVHNKATALANRQQIANLLPLVVKTFVQTGTDGSGNPIGFFEYTLAGVATEHRVKFFQVVPFGVTPPNNLYDLDSYKVFYGNNDTDKVGDHARFFNWLLKRGCDYGADVALYVRFPSLFGAADLDTALGRLTSTRVFLERVWGKAASVILLRRLRENRQETLDETLAFDEAVAALRAR